MLPNSELVFGLIRDAGPEDSELLSDKGGEEELSIGSTFTLHDTDAVVGLFIGGICIVIIIMGFIEDVSILSSSPEWLVLDELVGPD